MKLFKWVTTITIFLLMISQNLSATAKLDNIAIDPYFNVIDNYIYAYVITSCRDILPVLK